MKLKISDNLVLPVDAVTQAIGFLGRRGSGKTYAATKLAELMHAARGQFVAIDPVGIWYGLRLVRRRQGQGARRSDLRRTARRHPTGSDGGRNDRRRDRADRGMSTVLDVSQFESDADKARFARDFAARFFYRKKAAPSAVHLFIEEAQEFIPQNIQRGEEQMLHAFQRMIRLGRNYGIGVSMISQRPQDVNKKALNQPSACSASNSPARRSARRLRAGYRTRG
jgi:DNA helicase HerA-like ATPase